MNFYVRNVSTSVSDADAHVMAEACRLQMERQVAPAWGLAPSEFVFIGSAPAPPQANVLEIREEPERGDEGLSGYHDLTPSGNILGYVFAGPILRSGAQVLDGPHSVASVLSHEMIEARLDPWANYWVDTYGKLEVDGVRYAQVAFETVDPVEADEGNGIIVMERAVSLSNFVLPAWHNPNWDGETDYLSMMDPSRNDKSRPFFRSEGGYVIVRNHVGDEVAKFGARYPDWRRQMKAASISRTCRRMQGHMELFV